MSCVPAAWIACNSAKYQLLQAAALHILSGHSKQETNSSWLDAEVAQAEHNLQREQLVALSDTDQDLTQRQAPELTVRLMLTEYSPRDASLAP